METKQLQEMVKNFSKEKKLNNTVEMRLLDLVSEVGELAKEVLKGTNYGDQPFKITDNLTSEIGDVLFTLICIANETNIDLESSLLEVLDKYNKRYNQKGNLGS